MRRCSVTSSAPLPRPTTSSMSMATASTATTRRPPPFVDQLAPSYSCFGLVRLVAGAVPRALARATVWPSLWTISCSRPFPSIPPAEGGFINRLVFADDGVPTYPCPCDPGEWDPGLACNSGTPYCPGSIDLARDGRPRPAGSPGQVPRPWRSRACALVHPATVGAPSSRGIPAKA